MLALRQVEEIMGSKLGDATNPLLLSVRSGAAVSACCKCPFASFSQVYLIRHGACPLLRTRLHHSAQHTGYGLKSERGHARYPASQQVFLLALSLVPCYMQSRAAGCRRSCCPSGPRALHQWRPTLTVSVCLLRLAAGLACRQVCAGFMTCIRHLTPSHLKGAAPPRKLHTIQPAVPSPCTQPIGGLGLLACTLTLARPHVQVSMPGMMDTVLNLGMNDTVVAGLGTKAGERFAYDAYRRFLDMFGNVVMGVDHHLFEAQLEQLKVR